MPWRRTSDPYCIWLSEIMLQQTRVAAAIPHYERFLEKFPTVHRLARAKAETVLGLWAGLGYYSRARNLHGAAKQIVNRHDGKFPRTLEQALALPGIGSYTAAAVLSIAYNRPIAVLDGNVARVLARIGAVRGDLRAPALWRKLESAAQDLLASRTAGDWNQAMMELGATVCTPKSPRCNECPVAAWCEARRLGIASELPEARKKRATVKVTIAAAVWLDPRGETLLVRQLNSEGDLFSRMWQFPAVEAGSDARASLAEYLRMKFNFTLNDNVLPLSSRRHAVTYRDIRLTPFLIPVDRLPAIADSRAVPLAHIEKLTVSNATRKIADAAR